MTAEMSEEYLGTRFWLGTTKTSAKPWMAMVRGGI
jgi:hypothetical protein